MKRRRPKSSEKSLNRLGSTGGMSVVNHGETLSLATAGMAAVLMVITGRGVLCIFWTVLSISQFQGRNW